MRNLIIVSGSGRNVGKTECACRLIEKFSRSSDIIGLKVSAVYPDEQIYHGSHGPAGAAEQLMEEHRLDRDKDTSRMLRAGARRVFYLQGDDARLKDGFDQFRSLIPADAAVVCESGSLWRFVQPGLLILLTDGETKKPRSAELFDRASMIIHSDGESGFPGIEKVEFTPGLGWFLASGQSA
jgi:hypothetical protein